MQERTHPATEWIQYITVCPSSQQCHSVCVRTHVCVHVCVHVCARVCAYACVCMRVCVCVGGLCLCVHAYAGVYMLVCGVSLCVLTHVGVGMHVCKVHVLCVAGSLPWRQFHAVSTCC